METDERITDLIGQVPGLEIVTQSDEDRNAVEQSFSSASGGCLSFASEQPMLRVEIRDRPHVGRPKYADATVRIHPDEEDFEECVAALWKCAAYRFEACKTMPQVRGILDALFEGFARPAVIVGGDGTLVESNTAARRLLARDSARILGRDFDSLLSPDEEPLFSRVVEGLARTPQLPSSSRIRRRDGDDISVTAMAHPIASDDSTHACFIVVLADPGQSAHIVRSRHEPDRVDVTVKRIDGLITGGSNIQRIYNEVLKGYCRMLETEEALLAHFDETTGGIRVVTVRSASGRIDRSVHAAHREMSLEDSTSLIGRAIAEQRPALCSTKERLVDSSDPELEVENAVAIPLRRFGRTVGVVVAAFARHALPLDEVTLLRPLTSITAGLVASQLESEQRQLAEDQLQENARTTATLMANIPGVIFRAVDDDCRTVSFASSSVQSLLHVSADELCKPDGPGLSAFIAPSDRKSVIDELRWSLLRGERFERTYRVQRGGETIWVHEQSKGVMGPDGDLLFVEGFLTDITAERRAANERRKLEQRVRNAQRVDGLALLAESVALDFNNLLVGVLGNVQLLRGPLSGPETRRALEEIEESAERASDLTRYMLASTGRQFGRSEIHPIGVLIQRSLPMLERECYDPHTFTLELLEPQASVRVDPGAFQRVLLETVKNAVEALDAGGGQVIVKVTRVERDSVERDWHDSIEAADAYVSVDIFDDGEGMSEKTLAAALDSTFSTRGKGRGMGLASVSGVVRGHGGALKLSSTVGEGTHVRILLPELVGESPAVPAQQLPPRPLADEQPMILVVDDEPVVRETVQQLLVRNGFRAKCASGGAESIEMFEPQPQAIDAVLLDFSMPGMDGMATLEQLRRIRPDIPVVMSSGFANQPAISRVQSLDNVGFLNKPFRLDELLQVLTAAVARSERPAS